MPKPLSDYMKGDEASEERESSDPMRVAFDAFLDALDDGDREGAFEAFAEAVKCCVDDDSMSGGDEGSPHKGPALVIALGKGKR